MDAGATTRTCATDRQREGMTTTDLHNGWNVVLGQGEGFEARLFDAVTGEQMERSRFERKHLEGDANFDGWKSEEELASAVLAWTSETTRTSRAATTGGRPASSPPPPSARASSGTAAGPTSFLAPTRASTSRSSTPRTPRTSVASSASSRHRPQKNKYAPLGSAGRRWAGPLVHGDADVEG